MNFTFLNKAALDGIGIEWEDLKGRQCNAWKHVCSACNTEKCGIERYKRGESQSEYTNFGSHFHIDVAALSDSHGNHVGYIEIDHDVTDMKNMIVTLNGIMNSIKTVSEQVTLGSQQISLNSHDLADGAGTQASRIQELNSSIDIINERHK